jgi:hypothetical protein
MRRTAIVSAFFGAITSSLVACQLVSGLDRLSKVESLDGSTDSSPFSLAEEAGADSSTDSSAMDSAPDSGPLSAAGADSSTDSSVVDSAPDSSPLSSAADGGDDSSGSISIARVQSVAPGWVSAQETTLTLEENAGDLLVAGVYFDDSTVTIAVADSLDNVWTPTTAYANITPCPLGASGANASVVQIFYAEGVAAGGNVVTVTQSSGTTPLGAFLVEYSGIRASGSLEGTSGGPAPSSTPTMSAGSLTTEGAHDVVVALFAEATTGGTITPGPGFSTAANDASFYSLFEDDLPSGTGPGPIAPTATEPGGEPSDCWVGAAAAFTAGP